MRAWQFRAVVPLFQTQSSGQQPHALCLAWQVLMLPPLWRLGLLLATDAVFGATSYLFLTDAERFGSQRMQGVPAVPYPGATCILKPGSHDAQRQVVQPAPMSMQGHGWRCPRSGACLDFSRLTCWCDNCLPLSFVPPPLLTALPPAPVNGLTQNADACLQVLPLCVGTLLPIAATALALLSGDGQLMTTTCFAPYLLTLFCQIWMEGVFVRKGTQRLAFLDVATIIAASLYGAKGSDCLLQNPSCGR